MGDMRNLYYFKPFAGQDVSGIIHVHCLFRPLLSPPLDPLPYFPVMVGTGHKRTATELAPDTRTSTRTKTASSKQREISKSLFFSLTTTICITRKDKQTEASTLKELEQVK